MLCFRPATENAWSRTIRLGVCLTHCREMEEVPLRMGQLHPCNRAKQEGWGSASSYTFDSDQQKSKGGILHIQRLGKRRRQENQACVEEVQRLLQTMQKHPLWKIQVQRPSERARRDLQSVSYGAAKLAESCSFDTIRTNEILRDHLLFGVQDSNLRERLLRETNITLVKH